MFFNVLSTAFKNKFYYKYFNDIVTAAFLWKDIGKTALMFVNEIKFFRKLQKKNQIGKRPFTIKVRENPRSEFYVVSYAKMLVVRNSTPISQSLDFLYERHLRKKNFPNNNRMLFRCTCFRKPSGI